jgi:biopolymer transport protein ExbD
MSFKRKNEVKVAIPTSSMPDIIFMLLIFFMVTTVMKQYQGLQVKVPEAKKALKIEISKRRQVNLWVDRKSNIVVNDVRVNDINVLRSAVLGYMIKVPSSQILIKMDYDAKMGVLTDVIQQLRKAQALNVHYVTRLKE